jgi:hypothetical protein
VCKYEIRKEEKMKVNEIITEFKAQTTQADVAKAKQIAANVKQANATGDADAAMAAGAALGNMLMDKVMPDMIRFMDYAVRELEKSCKKYANDPNWAEECKKMPQLKADLAAMKKQAMQDGVALGRQDVGETASGMAAGDVATSMGGGNGFANGGPGTLTRMGAKKKSKKNKKA